MSETDLAGLVESTREEFRRRFGRVPSWIAAAPGRVNLIGEHIDYNDGFVLPMAIDRYVVIAADSASNSGRVNLNSVDIDDSVELSFESMSQPVTKHWATYPQGVLAGAMAMGRTIPAFDAVIRSNVPLGGGLSSSAALEVATSTLIEAMTNMAFEPTEKALLCQRAEHEFAGVPCGIMDQFSSVFGQADHLMLLDCRSHAIEQIPFDSLDYTVLIINSNVKHELVGGEYALRRSQCDSALRKIGISSWRDVTPADLNRCMNELDQKELDRACHVVSEIARTKMAAEMIKRSDWWMLGELMYSSHDSLRDDFEVSSDELDLLVEIAKNLGPDSGVIGSRMTGGGFGGCTVSLIKTRKAAELSAEIAERYTAATSVIPTCFTSRPARGAHRIQG